MEPTLDIVHGFAGLPMGAEWLIILLVVLLIFGKRLPGMMRGMGGSLKEFKKGMNEVDELKSSITKPITSSIKAAERT